MRTVVTIDPDAAEPPYEQLRHQLAARIADGSLPAGARLPTVRALAAELGLAPNTVARTYRELHAAELLETRGRAGTFVATASERDRRAIAAADAFAATLHELGFSAAEALRIVTGVLDPAAAWTDDEPSPPKGDHGDVGPAP
jgi:DNA-binding transcriptional regulator YhcF (GntR family)